MWVFLFDFQIIWQLLCCLFLASERKWVSIKPPEPPLDPPPASAPKKTSRHLTPNTTNLEVKEIFAVVKVLLHNCEDLLHFYSLSAVHSYDLYHVHFTPFSSSNGYKLNSHLTCFLRGFVAQSVEHRAGIAEVMGFRRYL